MRRIVIYRDPESDGWLVDVPSLPGCHTQGDSRDEVIANAQDAIASWIEAARAMGWPVPADDTEAEVLKVDESAAA